MQILTVSEAVAFIKALFEINPVTNDLWLSGEVSNCKRYASGHYYFTLKDAAVQVRCVLYKYNAVRQTHVPKDGSSFLMHGNFAIYEKQGELQFYVDLVKPSGLGKLNLQYEALKQRLEDEGLFAPERKRPLPARPKIIGVVTSPQAAAYQDILKVLGRRYPLGEVILSPTLVQGDTAPAQIANAIQALNRRSDIDVIIVARGGGSLEELWAFNDEQVARAIFASRIPIVTGVGHETDTTIVDYVADVRAPTPSAAAEIVAPDLSEMRQQLSLLRDNLYALLENELDTRRYMLKDTARRLQTSSPRNKLTNLRQQIATIQRQTATQLKHAITLRQTEVRSVEGRLVALNPLHILERGYAIVTTNDGVVLKNAKVIKTGQELNVQVSDGHFKVQAK